MNSSTQQNALVFTRYLYATEEVKHSLLLSLLDRNFDEALFWAYELYYSGMEEDTFEYLLSIYEIAYEKSNMPILGRYLKRVYERWQNDNKSYLYIALMVQNLIRRQYNIDDFIETYMGVKCEKNYTVKLERPFLTFKINIEEMNKYDTIEVDKPGDGRFVLQNAYRFPIRKEANQLFQVSNIVAEREYFYDWLYYASRCSLWENRIFKFEGVIDDEKKTVEFPDDDLGEEFYNYYGYEPDEQKRVVYQNSIGNGSEKQLSIKEFAQKYGGKIILKKMKMPALENIIRSCT